MRNGADRTEIQSPRQSIMTAVQLYKKLHQATIRGQVHMYFKWEAEQSVFILYVFMLCLMEKCEGT